MEFYPFLFEPYLHSDVWRDLRKYDSFLISMCIEGDCKMIVRSTGDEITLKEGHSTACIADYDVIPQKGNTRLLDAYIDNQNNGMKGFITKFLHLTNN